eukprot:1835256-Heterocapsa_arctica.AAC.1
MLVDLGELLVPRLPYLGRIELQAGVLVNERLVLRGATRCRATRPGPSASPRPRRVSGVVGVL